MVVFDRLGELGEVLGVATPHLVRLTRLLETLDGVLPDRLEHREALDLPPNEALVEQRRENVDVGLAHRLGGLECEPTREDGQSAEEPLLFGRTKLVTPLDRRPERLLTLWEVAPRGCQRRQPAIEPAEELTGRQHL